MNIIAQNDAVVNINVNIYYNARKKAKAKARREALRAEKAKPITLRWAEHKREAIKVGDRLVACGLSKRGYRVKMCGSEIIFRQCADCGHLMIERAQLCRDRLCPICNWRLALKRYSTMSQIMDVVRRTIPAESSIALMTYTVRNCKPNDIDATLTHMQTAWNRMLAQRYIRPYVIGWARSIEVTYNNVTGELHPHYHVIMITQDNSTLLDLQTNWLKQCRSEGLVVSMDAQHSEEIAGDHTEGDSLVKAILETYKYMVKSSDVIDMPLGVLRAFAEGVAGRRLISFGGIIKRIAKELGAAQLDSSEESDGEIELCTRCHSTALDRIIAQWSMRGNHYLAISGQQLSTEVWG